MINVFALIVIDSPDRSANSVPSALLTHIKARRSVGRYLRKAQKGSSILCTYFVPKIYPYRTKNVENTRDILVHPSEKYGFYGTDCIETDSYWTVLREDLNRISVTSAKGKNTQRNETGRRGAASSL